MSLGFCNSCTICTAVWIRECVERLESGQECLLSRSRHIHVLLKLIASICFVNNFNIFPNSPVFGKDWQHLVVIDS